MKVFKKSQFKRKSVLELFDVEQEKTITEIEKQQKKEWMQYPTILTRINPFLITSNRLKEKKDFTQELVLENAWGRITKYGPILNQKDEDVLIAVLCHAREYKDRDIKETLAYVGNIADIAKTLIKSDKPSGDTYSCIHKSLMKLASTVVNLEVKSASSNRYKRILTNNIISYIDYCKKTKKIKVIFNPKFYRLYIKKEYTQLHIETRLQSLKSPVEKKIYQFVASHRERKWKGSCKKLAKVLNLNANRPESQIKRTIKNAINSLVEFNLLSENSCFLTPEIVFIELKNYLPE
jgi:hypothetical protein